MRRSNSGFTLIELLIAAAVMAIVMVGLLNMFDQINRISRAQIDITDMQQSVRVAHAEIVQTVRMAGRGKLPNSEMLLGPTITVRNNVTGVDRSLLLDNNPPEAVTNTDILTVRGVIDGSLYVVDYSDPTSFTAPQANATGPPAMGTVRVVDVTPFGFDVQDTQALIDLGNGNLNNPTPVALVFVNALNPSVYGVAQLTRIIDNTTNPFDPTYNGLQSNVVLEFTTNYTNTSLIGWAYQQLNPLVVDSDNDGDLDTRGLPNFASGVVFVGVLDEHRFYVRDERSGGADPRLMPRLSRAKMYPGTQLAFGGDNANLTLDIADNIFDLQVALGFDAGIAIDEHFNYDTDNVGDDDILMPNDWAYSADSPDLTADEWVIDPNDAAGIPEEPLELYFARITTVGRTGFPDLGYNAHETGADVPANVEDHNYSTDMQFYDLFTSSEGVRYRRMLLETMVELRNIS